MRTKFLMRSAAPRSLPVEFMDSKMSCARSRLLRERHRDDLEAAQAHPHARDVGQGVEALLEEREVLQDALGRGVDGARRVSGLSTIERNVARSPLESVSLWWSSSSGTGS